MWCCCMVMWTQLTPSHVNVYHLLRSVAYAVTEHTHTHTRICAYSNTFNSNARRRRWWPVFHPITPPIIRTTWPLGPPAVPPSPQSGANHQTAEVSAETIHEPCSASVGYDSTSTLSGADVVTSWVRERRCPAGGHWHSCQVCNSLFKRQMVCFR